MYVKTPRCRLCSCIAPAHHSVGESSKPRTCKRDCIQRISIYIIPTPRLMHQE